MPFFLLDYSNFIARTQPLNNQMPLDDRGEIPAYANGERNTYSSRLYCVIQ